jgi:predicted double-glycine peptidase
VASLVALPASALAESNDYEGQITSLEKRVHELETVIMELKSQRTQAPDAAAAPAGDQSAQAANGDGAAAAGADGKKAEQAKRELTPEDRTLLQDLFVVRDQAVTLQAGKWEVSTDFSYTRADGFLQKSRGFAVSPTIRYGFGNGLELSVSGSENFTHRDTQVGGGAPAFSDQIYSGDINTQLNWAAIHESKDLPGFVFYGGVVIPTGSPYVSGNLTAGLNPSSVFDYYQNRSGHYAINAGVEAFRTFAPVVVFGGIGASYAFPKEYGGISIAPGYAINWNLGYTFAVSEVTSFGMTVLGSYRPDMVTGGVRVPSSGSEPVSVRFSVLGSWGLLCGTEHFARPDQRCAGFGPVGKHQVHVLSAPAAPGTTGSSRTGRARGRAALACIPLILVLAAGCTTDKSGEQSKKLIEPVTPYQTLKFKDIEPQVLDFSCGASSLATLVGGVYGERFKEVDLLKILRAQFDGPTWRIKQKEGFSFADLAFLASQIGYQAEGVEIGFAELTKVNAPVIVQLAKPDFLHFSVFRGVENGLILMADPITGRTAYAPDRFAEEYTGFALAVWKDDKPIPKEYALLVSAKDGGNELRHLRSSIYARERGMHTNF